MINSEWMVSSGCFWNPRRVGEPSFSGYHAYQATVGGPHWGFLSSERIRSWLSWRVRNTWFLEMQASVIWLIHGTWAGRVLRLLYATRAWFGESAMLLLLSLEQCNNAVAWQLLKLGSRPVRAACSLSVHSSRCCGKDRNCRELLHTLFLLWESYFGPRLSWRGERAGVGCSVSIFTHFSHMSFSMVSPHSIPLSQIVLQKSCYAFSFCCHVL